MFKVIRNLNNRNIISIVNNGFGPKYHRRTFLSQAYYCDEVWNHRLNSPLLQKVNLEELFYDLDQRYQNTSQISAVDVDIFANAISDDSYVDELLHLIHKLRLSADTTNTLESTSHAVIRHLLQNGKHEDLLSVLDDRLNYGIFLDYYTANILMDTYWKNKDFTSGARIASQLMLQEEFEHPVSNNFSLLHCYNYLLSPGSWPIPSPPEEPEDEVKIRVKYLRNPYDDEHFDLRDPNKIVGKVLALCTKGRADTLGKSLNILGWVLYNKYDKASIALKECKEKNIGLIKEIVDLVPEDEIKNKISELKIESADVENILKTEIEKAVRKTCETDIAEQCRIFERWEERRVAALEEQNHRLSIAQRLKNVEDLKEALKTKETKLWFFDNEEQIELDIESKKVYYPKRWFGHKKKPKKVDESYIPPEIFVKQSN